MKAISVGFSVALLVGGWAGGNCWGQGLSEQECLSAVLPRELIRYAGVEVPSRENIQVLSEPAGEYLEFRLVPGQAKKNNGIRAEISVDYPYRVGDTVRYRWDMRLPKDFAADDPRNRWWVMGQWHDQPDKTKGETWQGFPAQSPPVSFNYFRRDGKDWLSLMVGSPKMKSVGLLPVTRGAWHVLDVVIKWSQGDDGRVAVFWDGSHAPVVTGTGPNMHNGFHHYLKLGMYRHPAIATENRLDIRNVRIEQLKDWPVVAPRSRTFRMGFTGFVYDTTPEALAASRKFVRENGDILAHHIEGVPWTQALNGQPFPQALLEEWKSKQLAAPTDGKIYLAISPGRGELKMADKAGPLPAELKGKPYDDPLVMKAYLAYCRRAIEFFKPDYLAIGIEVNEIHNLGPRAWGAYVALHKQVYAELKKEHPNLPIFASFTLHNMFKQRGRMLEQFKQLMPYNDLLAVSYYPFFMPDKDRLAALDWLFEQFDEFKKPYAVVETNDAAERLALPRAKVVIDGTPEKQAAYYRRLLALAERHDFVFVISFIHQDYDALWEKIKATAPELFMAWRDCGLLDEKGNARPARQVWADYFNLPLSK